MRWIHHDPKDVRESQQRAQILDSIDRWWRAFVPVAPELEQVFKEKSKFDLPEFMRLNLSAIDPRLMWEYGPALKGNGHRLVITPESDQSLHPMVAALLERAPRIEGWEFYPHRPAEGIDAHAIVEGRTGCRGQELAVRGSLNSRRQIDLVFQGASVEGPQDKRWLNGAFIAAETFLGEEILDKWIGLVEVQKRPGTLANLFGRKSGGFVSLDNFKGMIDALITSCRDQTPSQPYFQIEPTPYTEGRQWTSFKLDPQEGAEDYPDWSDMFVAMSADANLFQATHSSTFFSERYSKLGETFCYLKIDGSNRPAGAEAEYRQHVEDAVQLGLHEAKLGCGWGGGSGHSYCYVDLVLTDVRRAIPVIRDALHRKGVPKRSWLLFYDAYMSEEWVGIYDDSPPPPMRPREASE